MLLPPDPNGLRMTDYSGEPYSEPNSPGSSSVTVVTSEVRWLAGDTGTNDSGGDAGGATRKKAKPR